MNPLRFSNHEWTGKEIHVCNFLGEREASTDWQMRWAHKIDQTVAGFYIAIRCRRQTVRAYDSDRTEDGTVIISMNLETAHAYQHRRLLLPLQPHKGCCLMLEELRPRRVDTILIKIIVSFLPEGRYVILEAQETMTVMQVNRRILFWVRRYGACCMMICLGCSYWMVRKLYGHSVDSGR